MTDQNPLRVAFHTLGCRLNQYDTESIKAAMHADRPMEVVGWEDDADLYVLNSCTVTAKADQECRRLARQVKRRRPASKVVVAGCYAQTQPQDLAAIAEVDGVVGNTAKDHVAEWLPQVLGGRADAPHVAVAEFGRRPEFDAPLIAGFEGRSRAFVKIQDGCDLRCAYCLIWQARGPGRSRPASLVLEQIRRLHEEAGYRELVLTGVHMGSYGRDRRDGTDLLGLVAAIADRFPDLRLRLSSIHPNEVTPELLQLIATRPQLRPHLHISLQSGSDSVLRRMRRPYRARTAWTAIAAAGAADAACGIGADVIVGFPGETDADFEETYRLVEMLPFTYLHVFRFSPRPGTPAATMDGAVHPETVTERSARLRALATTKRERFHRALIGQPREAVVESEDTGRPGWRHATTDNYAQTTVACASEAGTLVRVVPEAWRDGRLQARVLQEANA